MNQQVNQPAPGVQPTCWPSTGVVCFSAFLGAGIGIGIYCLIQKKQNQKTVSSSDKSVQKKQNQKTVSNSDKGETKFVFVSMNGTPTIFTEDQVLEIKRLHEDGTSPIEIAHKFKTTVLMVSRIVYGIKL